METSSVSRDRSVFFQDYTWFFLCVGRRHPLKVTAARDEQFTGNFCLVKTMLLSTEWQSNPVLFGVCISELPRYLWINFESVSDEPGAPNEEQWQIHAQLN
jgi:hypothetical protein